MIPDLWALILAGGAGRRLMGVTGGVPKQFWAFRDGPTLVEETARRIAPLAPAEQRVTVVDVSHDRLVERLRYRRALGRIARQPGDRGTAAGVMLGLLPVLASDPDGIVLVTPADHGVVHVDVFQQGILAAAALVRQGLPTFVLFGIEPAGPAPDYGWITPRPNGRAGPGHFARVDRFCEKPGREEAERLYGTGAVWNTMVLVGRAAAIFAACEHGAPEAAALFRAASLVPEAEQARLLADGYRTIASVDLSRDVIARARSLALYTWPGRMGWSDLGTPERLRAWREHPVPPPGRHAGPAGVLLPGVA